MSNDEVCFPTVCVVCVGLHIHTLLNIERLFLHISMMHDFCYVTHVLRYTYRKTIQIQLSILTLYFNIVLSICCVLCTEEYRARPEGNGEKML